MLLTLTCTSDADGNQDELHENLASAVDRKITFN